MGEALTRPLRIAGDSLEVNYATDATGWIRFELCKSGGIPIRGFTLYDSEALFGNELQHTVKWRGRSLSGLSEKSVRLRIRMENADLYSIRFVGSRSETAPRHSGVSESASFATCSVGSR